MRALAALLLACCLAVAGCGDSQTPASEQGAEALPQLEIHRPFQPGPGSVNSYWLEGPDEVLVFDTQGRLDLARRIVTAIERTGKPVTAIIISHYHPDHFGGLQEFLEAFPDAELLMPEAVAEQIGRDLSGHVERLREIHGDEYEMPPDPHGVLSDGDELEVSGVPVMVRMVEGAESTPIAMLEIPSQRAVIVSDVVTNSMHPELAAANLDSWPRVLDRLSRQFSDYTVYPGHGDPGPAGLLFANQQAYLAFMRQIVDHDILEDGTASDAEVNEALATIRSRYAGWETTTGNSGQLRRNLEALVAEFGGRMEPPPAGEAVRGSAGS